MNKYYQAIINTSGDAKALSRVQVLDNTGDIVTIYADKSGTRFTDATGANVNYCEADATGMVEFYWTAASGQTLQVLDSTGELERSIADFANNFSEPEAIANVDAVLGVTASDGDLGTFTGATITDNVAIKPALQELETAVELRATSTALAATTGATLIGTSDGKTAQQWVDITGSYVNVLEYIPVAEHAAILAGTSTYDCATEVQAAVDANTSVFFPNGLYNIGTTIREAANGGARNLRGANRLYCKIKATPALAATGAPIFWFGNSNGHGNYRLQFEGFYIDGNDAATSGVAGAIGLRAHECGTSHIDNLYIRYCQRAIDQIGCIGTKIGGGKIEVISCEEGIIATDPTGGGVALGGNSITTTESVLSLNDNINHVSDIWFSAVKRPMRFKGGLTHANAIVLQSCGGGATDDLIHFLDANESYDYGAGPEISHLWAEGGNYRSIVRIETSRDVLVSKSFFSGSGANCEQGIIVTGSSGARIRDCAFRGSWSRTPTEARTGNHAYYVHGDSKNGYFGPNYYTQATVTPKIEWTTTSQNHIEIKNHTAGNNMSGITIGNIQIDGNYVKKNPDQAGAVNLYIQDMQYLGELRAAGASGSFNADVSYKKSNVQVVGARKTGWAVATGTATRTTFDTTTVTTAQLAERVKALIDDLHGTAGHGLIGT